MKEFEYLRPANLEEACRLKAQWGEEARVLAGGQSLLNMMKLRFATPACLIDLSRLPELQQVRSAGSAVSIGSMLTYSAAKSALPDYGVVQDALEVIADMQVRNLGTLGGSCCQADPFGDMPNIVRALGVQMEALSSSGSRMIAAEEFITGPLETSMRPDEVLTRLHFPELPPGSGSAYEKFSYRKGDYAIVSIAAVLTVDGDGRCASASLVAGGMGVGPAPLPKTAAAMLGQRLDEEQLARIAKLARGECEPADDAVYGSAAYKRALVQTLTGRALARAWSRAQASAQAGA
jgi:carbon-monoxide dehydrogenase medium subunit